MFRNKEWIAPTVATGAFLVALVAFAVALTRYLDWVIDWSKSDLQLRAEMAAAALAEPIRTLDFKAIDRAAITSPRGRNFLASLLSEMLAIRNFENP